MNRTDLMEMGTLTADALQEGAVQVFEEMIAAYYNARGYQYPDTWEALGFVTTELGEVYEVLLAEKGGWIRNNPQDKPKYSPEALGEELGDVIMMAMVAGLARGVNPARSLTEKIHRKIAAQSRDPGDRGMRSPGHVAEESSLPNDAVAQ